MKWYPTKKIGLRKKADPKKLKLARQMRKNPTKAEAALWEHLKGCKLGAKFKRQALIRGWIADFWCAQAGVVVEVDGHSHDNKKEYDAYRDAIMTGLGIQVLRFTNDEVLTNPTCVLAHIRAHLI